MATDIIIYLLILIASLGFGLLSFADRLFGIVAMLIGLIGGLYIENDGGQIFTAQVFNVNTSAWVFSIIPATEFSELMILLGLVIAIDAVILILRTLR